MGEQESMGKLASVPGRAAVPGCSRARRAGRPRGPEARYLNVRLSVAAFERLVSDARSLSTKPGTLARQLIEQRSVVVGDSPLLQDIARSYHTLASNMNQIAWHANRCGSLDADRVEGLAVEVAALRRQLAKVLGS